MKKIYNGKESEKEYMYISITVSLCYIPETIVNQLYLYSYILYNHI